MKILRNQLNRWFKALLNFFWPRLKSSRRKKYKAENCVVNFIKFRPYYDPKVKIKINDIDINDLGRDMGRDHRENDQMNK